MHPLGTDLSNISDEELQKKFGDLQKRFQQCYRMGPYQLIPQIQMLIDDYQAEITRRNQKVYDEMMKKAEAKGKPGIIDIS